MCNTIEKITLLLIYWPSNFCSSEISCVTFAKIYAARGVGKLRFFESIEPTWNVIFIHRAVFFFSLLGYRIQDVKRLRWCMAPVCRVIYLRRQKHVLLAVLHGARTLHKFYCFISCVATTLAQNALSHCM